jgi:hypothetical protein
LDTPSGVNPASGEEPVTAGAPNRVKIVLYWTIATTAGLFLYHLCYQYVFYHWLVSAMTGQAPGAMPLVIVPISVAQSLISGIILGGAQWLVLRHYVRWVNGWIPASMAAWTIWSCILFAYDVLLPRYWFVLDWLGVQSMAGQLLAFAEIQGLIIGCAQWIILRRLGSQTFLWILVVIGGQFANVIVGHMQVYPPVATSLGCISEGLLTGLGMAYLLKKHWANGLQQHLAAGDENDPITFETPLTP